MKPVHDGCAHSRPRNGHYVALPIDERVASVFAEIVAWARRSGRRATVTDAWIAATARAHSVAVYAQDDDFDALAVEVVRV